MVKERTDFELRRPFKGGYFTFTFDEDAKGRGLDATSRESVAELGPNESRQVIAEEAVEDTTRFLSLFQIVINFTRVFDCLSSQAERKQRKIGLQAKKSSKRLRSAQRKIGLRARKSSKYSEDRLECLSARSLKKPASPSCY